MMWLENGRIYDIRDSKLIWEMPKSKNLFSFKRYKIYKTKQGRFFIHHSDWSPLFGTKSGIWAKTEQELRDWIMRNYPDQLKKVFRVRGT